MKKISIQMQILTVAILIIAAIGLIFYQAVQMQRAPLDEAILEEMDLQSKNYISQISSDVYKICANAQVQLEADLNRGVQMVNQLVLEQGGIVQANDLVTWRVHKDSEAATQNVQLPRMLLGSQWFGQSRDPVQKMPLVDLVEKLGGVKTTIFQRMNSKGDMLRVANNVLRDDGKRNVGTYISLQAESELAQVLAGQKMQRRELLGKDWYLSSYAPLFDAGHKVIGLMRIAVPHTGLKALRQAIMDIKVGKSGYVFVLGGKGTQQGHYLISAGGKRDGANIWGAKDSTGRLFIQDIVKTGIAQKPGGVGFVRYPWSSRADGKDRPGHKISAISYFAPWDWVIGAGTYEDDFQDVRDRVDASLDKLLNFVFWAAIFMFLIGSGAALLLARSIHGKIRQASLEVIKLAQDVRDGRLQQRADRNAVNVDFSGILGACREKSTFRDRQI